VGIPLTELAQQFAVLWCPLDVHLHEAAHHAPLRSPITAAIGLLQPPESTAAAPQIEFAETSPVQTPSTYELRIRAVACSGQPFSARRAMADNGMVRLAD
jgi:hypothetical protein